MAQYYALVKYIETEELVIDEIRNFAGWCREWIRDSEAWPNSVKHMNIDTFQDYECRILFIGSISECEEKKNSFEISQLEYPIFNCNDCNDKFSALEEEIEALKAKFQALQNAIESSNGSNVSWNFF